MTRKRYKKILMGICGSSRNQAKFLSYGLRPKVIIVDGKIWR